MIMFIEFLSEKKCATAKSYFNSLLAAFVLLLGFAFPHVSIAQGSSCTDIFSVERTENTTTVAPLNLAAMVRLALGNESLRSFSPLQRTVFFFMRKSIHKKVGEACREAGCTEQDVARIVETSIVDSMRKIDHYKSSARRIRGYAVLTGLSVGVAVMSHYVKDSLPAGDAWLSDFVTIASSIGLYKLGAPLWDHIGGIASRGAFRIKDGKSFFREAEEMARYERGGQILQEKMTLREQQETARIAGLLNSTESTFTAAIESILSKDPSKGGIERAAARIANTAIKTRKFFPEVAFDDPDMTRTIQMVFTTTLPNDGTRERLYELVIAAIQAYDPAFSDPRTAEVYRATVRKWTGLD